MVTAAVNRIFLNPEPRTPAPQETVERRTPGRYRLTSGRPMRAYLIVSGLLFVLVVVAHVARLAVEGWWHLREPDFMLSTLAVLAMAAWAAYLLMRFQKAPAAPRKD